MATRLRSSVSLRGSSTFMLVLESTRMTSSRRMLLSMTNAQTGRKSIRRMRKRKTVRRVARRYFLNGVISGAALRYMRKTITPRMTAARMIHMGSTSLRKCRRLSTIFETCSLGTPIIFRKKSYMLIKHKQIKHEADEEDEEIEIENQTCLGVHGFIFGRFSALRLLRPLRVSFCFREKVGQYCFCCRQG